MFCIRRALRSHLDDERSDDEDDGEDETETTKIDPSRTKSLKKD